MEETALLFKHLPAELSTEERKDLLHYLGATRVDVMGKAGPMKNAAFAVFASKEKASQVLNQLHQVEFLGSSLVVEYAKKNIRSNTSVVDNEGVARKAVKGDGENGIGKSENQDKEQVKPREVKFDSTFNTWGLKHPRRPDLKYLYPPPTPSILSNIMNALAAVPKFYVQVLHLMNKMDLPAPFGAVTLAPPLHPDVREPAMPDDIHQREMEISSESESELESGEEEKDREERLKENYAAKRLQRRPKKTTTKKPRLADLQESGIPVPVTASSVQVSEVFEQISDSGVAAKKIELKLPSALMPLSAASQPGEKTFSLDRTFVSPSLHGSLDANHQRQSMSIFEQNEQQLYPANQNIPPASSSTSLQPHHGLPPLPQQQHSHPSLTTQPENTDSFTQPSSPQRSYNVEPPTVDMPTQPAESESQSATVGGFGIIEPVHKEGERRNDEEESAEKEWGKSKFISSSELKKNRLSHSEIKDLGVFKRYDKGEPSCRLYIKNVAKQVTEEDLHWIYGRYVQWDDETESNIFDIRLMKEGRMKGQAFVTLPSEKVASMALKDTNGFLLKDKPLVVQFARSAKAQQDEKTKA